MTESPRPDPIDSELVRQVLHIDREMVSRIVYSELTATAQEITNRVYKHACDTMMERMRMAAAEQANAAQDHQRAETNLPHDQHVRVIVSLHRYHRGCPVCGLMIGILTRMTRMQLGPLDLIVCRCVGCCTLTLIDASILDDDS